MTGLNTCTRFRAILARLSLRISSSLLPENIGPQMTSIQPALPATNSIGNFDRNIMFTKSHRIIAHEILDEQTPERAKASLRDLVRINRYLGGHEALRQ